MMSKGKVFLIAFLLIVFLVGGCVVGFFVNPLFMARNKGSISVASRPDEATIFWNGEEVDEKTDARFTGLSPGKYIIELKKKGYLTWKTKVVLSPGEKVDIVAFLVKKPAEAKTETETTEKKEEKKPVFKDTVAPSTPAQVSPSDGVQVEGDTATLEWSAVSDPSGVTYSVEIQYRAGGGVGFVEKEVKTGLTDTKYTYTMSGMMERWRVWAVDGVGNSSPKSEWWGLVKKA